MADNQPTAGDAGADAAAAVAKLHLDEVTGEMISKTELKKRQKVREREAAKKEKADKAGPAAGAGKKSAEAAEKELTPNQVCAFFPGACAKVARRATILKLTLRPCSTLRFAQELSTSSTLRARLIPTR